jgi:hypothetical protein
MLMVEGKIARWLARRHYDLILRVFLASAFLWFLVFAGSVAAVGISQGFNTTDKELQTSMIAALGLDDTTKRIVERASGANKGKVVGIVTTIDANLLTLTNAEAKVHITTSGEAPTYVTDLNGDIKKGDFIAVSPLAGVGMKAGDDDALVVGIALEDFNNDTASSQQVSTVQGSGRTVLVNKIKVNVEPQDRGRQAQKERPFLVLFGQSVTGKSVSQTQVIVAMVLFFLLLVVEGSIIYGAIHSTIISIGRNPLARSALYQQLLQVSWLSLLVLLFGLGAIYAILWI